MAVYFSLSKQTRRGYCNMSHGTKRGSVSGSADSRFDFMESVLPYREGVHMSSLFLLSEG